MTGSKTRNPSFVRVYDTTLRDGNQSVAVSLTVSQKLRIARYLSTLGVQYVEGGWPNPGNLAENEFFRRITKERLQANIISFGMTRRPAVDAQNDLNLRSLIDSETQIVTLVGKSSVFHVKNVLQTSLGENLNMIRDSISLLRKHGRRVIYDAEHFFDAAKEDMDYAFSTIEVAANAGAEEVVLCDTRGSAYPHEISRLIQTAEKKMDKPIGIHAHNDRGLATANTLAAVMAGASQVQVTVNGIGERCGNADLVEVVGNLELLGFRTGISTAGLRGLSRFVCEVTNARENSQKPFVGAHAFTHKAGLHGDAVAKASEAYEHVDPAIFGNQRDITVSAQAGRASVVQAARRLGFDLERNDPRVSAILGTVKKLEAQGVALEVANATLSLIFARKLRKLSSSFRLVSWKADIAKRGKASAARCTLKLSVRGHTLEKSSVGNGPVNAFDLALRKALSSEFPEISKMRLTAYRVRELDPESATAAKVAVHIDYSNSQSDWTAAAVSTNILDASLRALIDGYEFFLWRQKAGGGSRLGINQTGKDRHLGRKRDSVTRT
jgi:2-isopropylmalate synthase